MQPYLARGEGYLFKQYFAIAIYGQQAEATSTIVTKLSLSLKIIVVFTILIIKTK